MAATADQIAQLRRMTNEVTSSTYSDTTLAGMIAANAIPDSEGRPIDHDDWEDTYDLNATAAEIWAEKAAAFSTETDFSADGGSFSRSQLYEMAIKQSRFYAARQTVRSMTLERPRVKNRYSDGYGHGGYDVAATHGTH